MTRRVARIRVSRLRITASLIAATSAMSARAAAEAPSVDWKGIMHAEAPDKSYTIEWGGRIQSDWTWWPSVQSGLAGAFEDGHEFRRIRLLAQGTIFQSVEYRSQIDVAGGAANVRDMYVGVRGLPALGVLRVGDQYEPFGLEELTSDAMITFVERSLVSSFAPSRNVGWRAQNAIAGGRGIWSAGIFRDSDNTGRSVGSGEYAATARLCGTPVYGREGADLLHLGAAVSRRVAPGDMLQYRARPEVNLLAGYLVDTGAFSAESVTLVGVEGAWMRDRISVQGEAVQAMVTSAANGDPAFTAFYVQGTLFLTPDRRAYKTADGVFGRIKPSSNFTPDGGTGAWELAVRFSSLDLNDGPIAGGQITVLNVGLNGYLNPNTRWTWNVVHGDVDGVGSATAVVSRLGLDF